MHPNQAMALGQQFVPHTRLGSYELVELLGQGAMGHVYRALDTRLNRPVAIKIVHGHVADVAKWRLRYQREARALSNAAHPNICTLYDIGREQDADFLVMEYLDGETLAQRLSRGPLPIEQVLRYGSEIAGALGHAHRHGIVHRDVKPSNVILTKTGAKLLDFGIATNLSERSGFDSWSEEKPDTRTQTFEGTIAGTVNYMAPEQLEGRGADPRSDIFALGCILYEALSGRKAHDAASTAGVIASVLTREPPKLTLDDSSVSWAFERVVAKCLAQSPDDRWQNAEDLKFELDSLRQRLSERASSVAAPQPASMRRKWVAAAIPAAIALLLAFGVGRAVSRPGPAMKEGPIARFTIPPPPGSDDPTFALDAAMSPNGEYLILPSSSGDNPGDLWIRPLSSTGTRALEGGHGAVGPFWSPDSQTIAFFADGQLKKLGILGGDPQLIAHVRLGKNPTGTWNRDGAIVIGSLNSGLFRVDSNGGAPKELVPLNVSDGDQGYWHPSFLPDGRHLIYTARSLRHDRSGVYLTTLDAPAQRTRLLPIGDGPSSFGKAVYMDPGFLLFEREGTLFALPFDARNLRVGTVPKQVVTGVTSTGRRSAFSVSSNGVLAYQIAEAQELRWFDRAGNLLRSVARVGSIGNIAISPTGTQVAFSSIDQEADGQSLWIGTISLPGRARLTSPGAHNQAPVWSPDGTRIAFASDRTGPFNLYVRSIGNSKAEEVLLQSPEDVWPLNWSLDGRFLLYHDDSDLWVLPMTGERTPIFIASTRPEAPRGQISPDGNWVAHVSGEDGTRNIVLRSVHSPAERIRVSTTGGMEPAWRPDGKELYYLTLRGTLMAVKVKLGKVLEVDQPRRLFDTRLDTFPVFDAKGRNRYAVINDDNQFLIDQPREPASVVPITIAVNWRGSIDGGSK
jgi:eukaryotic-like serine/threonine-protein kinase